jgi:membrane protein implicated in regulation of membrane protease activity
MIRRALFALAVLGLLGVGAAVTIWLGWHHSDTELARWGSIAGIISAGLSVLAVILALAPILDRKTGAREHDSETAQAAPSEGNVTQNIDNNYGAVQANGVQFNSFGEQKR